MVVKSCKPMQAPRPATPVTHWACRPSWVAAASPCQAAGERGAAAAEEASSPRAAAACESRLWFSEGVWY